MRALVDALPERLAVWREVKLTSSQVAKRVLAVDVLAIDEDCGVVFGFEVKSHFYRMADYAKAIKQASDYRLGLISDKRLPDLANRRLDAAFVFPRWHGGHDIEREYGQQAEGMEILAHHFRVGFAETVADALIAYTNGKVAFKDGDWTHKGFEFCGAKDRIGSQRSVNPSKGSCP